MSEKRKNILIDITIIILIVAIGIAVRMPAGALPIFTEGEYLPNLVDADSYLYARRAVEFESGELPMKAFIYRTEDPMMTDISGGDAYTTNGLPILANLVHSLTGIELWKIIYYLCAVLCPFAAVPAYIFIKRRGSRIGAFTGALLLATSGAFGMHTLPGYFDTDAVIAVLATTAMCCSAEALLAEKAKNTIVYGGLTILSIALLSVFWEAYYIYALLAIGAGTVGYIAARFAKEQVAKTGTALIFAGCTALATFTMGLIAAKGSISRLAGIALGDINLIGSGVNLPDAGKFVSELQRPGVLEQINRIGGIPAALFIIVIIAVAIYKAISTKRKGIDISGMQSGQGTPQGQNMQIFTAAFLASWLLVTLPLAFSGLRFAELSVIPLALLAGFVFSFAEKLDKAKRSKNAVMILLAVLLLVSPLCSMTQVSKSDHTYVGSGRAEMTQWLRDNTEENAVIASWWDYGYYYQFAAGRRTISDGGQINDEWFYWLGKAFTCDSPEKSAYMLKTLAAKGISDIDTLKYIDKTEKPDSSVIRKAIGEDSDAPIYFVISGDMVNKAGTIGYYGTYDGTDKEPVCALSDSPVEIPCGSEGWVNLTGIADCTAHIKRGETGALTVTLERTNGTFFDIKRCIFVKDGVTVTDATDPKEKPDDALVLYIIEHGSEISIAATSAEIADSTLLRLALRNGEGQSSFTPVFGNGNTVWRVN